MSAATIGRSQSLGVTLPRVIRSEWTKLRTVRSTYFTLLVAVALFIGVSALVTAVRAHRYHDFSAAQRADFNPVQMALAGIVVAQLAIGVLGVLAFSSEYSSGMIRSSLAAVPRRLPVLWSKLIVVGVTVFVVSLVTVLVSFFVTQAILAPYHLNVAITSAGTLNKLWTRAVYLTEVALICVALGALLRSTAGGISTFVGVFFVLPPITALLPADIGNSIMKYLPGSTVLGDNLSLWAGIAVMAGYAAIVVIAAAVRLQWTDA